MTTPSKHTPTSDPSGRRGPPASNGDDRTEQDQRDMSSSRARPSSSDGARKDPDQVEIGDPVPEDDRTIKAAGNRGETGEDEDLPGDVRGGEAGEDEDLPEDDAGIERPGGQH